LGIAHPSQNVEPQHPPHKKQGDDTEDNVCHPLAGGFWFSKVEHWAIVAFRSAADFFNGWRYPRPEFFVHQFCDPMEGSELGRRQRTPAAYGSPGLTDSYFTRLILTIDILSG
jgi:hypothetical protein